MQLLVGDVSAIPLPDAAVDRLLTVNTVYFWPDLAVPFGELRRVLAPGGRLVIGIRDGSVVEHVDLSIFTLRTAQELVAELTAAGFSQTAIDTPEDGKTHFITAIKP